MQIFLKRVLDSVGVSAFDTIMVGDDIDSDVGGAQSLQIRGCLVKTGKFRHSYFEQSQIKPDMLAESVVDFSESLLKK